MHVSTSFCLKRACMFINILFKVDGIQMFLCAITWLTCIQSVSMDEVWRMFNKLPF
jgi:hypothetical protein